MIPSTVYDTPIGRVLVCWRYERYCKRDALGRRIPSRARIGQLLGFVVARRNQDAVDVRDLWIDRQEFPASKNHREALEEYINARTDLKA